MSIFPFNPFLAYHFYSRFTVPLLSGQPLQSFTSLAACTLVLKYITWGGSSLVSSKFHVLRVLVGGADV